MEWVLETMGERIKLESIKSLLNLSIRKSGEILSFLEGKSSLIID